MRYVQFKVIYGSLAICVVKMFFRGSVSLKNAFVDAFTHSTVISPIIKELCCLQYNSCSARQDGQKYKPKIWEEPGCT
jgi:hypothetical protein